MSERRDSGYLSAVHSFSGWRRHQTFTLCCVSVSVSVSVASKTECIERFGQRTIERINTDNDIICTTEYSRIVPLENGEVTTWRRLGNSFSFKSSHHWCWSSNYWSLHQGFPQVPLDPVNHGFLLIRWSHWSSHDLLGVSWSCDLVFPQPCHDPVDLVALWSWLVMWPGSDALLVLCLVIIPP